MVRLAVVAVLALASPTLAQVDTAWTRRYNGPGSREDVAWDIAVDSSGCIIIAGMSIGVAGNYDYATVKYDSSGDTLWTRRYDGSGAGDDRAYAMVVDRGGNVHITGRSLGADGTLDFATIKYIPTGGVVWVRRYAGRVRGTEEAYALAVDDAGNVYVTGTSYSSDETNYDIATVKYSPDGVQLWDAVYNGPDSLEDEACAIAVDSSGNVYVAGLSGSRATWSDYITIKYGANGETLWVRKYDGPANESDRGRSVALDGAGNVYVTGSSMGVRGMEDWATVKYGPDGQELWSSRYDGPPGSQDRADKVVVDDEGNVYVTGDSPGLGTSWDYATVKYSPAGESLWVRRYDGPGHSFDYPRDIVVDRGGNVFVTGDSRGENTFFDGATIKYGPDGDELWVARYGGPGDRFDGFNALALGQDGTLFATGASERWGTQVDFVTVKYVPSGAVQEPAPPAGWPSEVLLTNPSKGRIRAAWAGSSGEEWALRLYDAQGALVESARGRMPSWSTDGLSAGTYLLQVEAANRTVTRSLVVLR